MGLKKYEIITVGSNKRVRALRSWQVGDRYVNTGDVGGIVYDEKTLSQDGLCWLFRGNFGFPGARIGGDSIVDVGEATLSTTGTPAVDILGSSVVVGNPLRIASDQTAADAVVVGETITGITANTNRVSVPIPFRVNGAKGLTVNCPTGVGGSIIYTDINGVIKALTTLATGESSVPAARLVNTNAYLMFKKADGVSPITPADLAGVTVTVTVYNGCKIVNTGATAVNMKGNIRVEDNATPINASVVGTGYFGGNCVASGLILNGCAFMDGNATLVKTSEGGTMRQLYMRDNSRAVISAVTVFGRLDLRDNAVFSPASYGVSEADIIMRDNATITSGLSANGVLKMEGNATVSNGSVTIAGDITLCGSYNQTVNKTWTGKRVIDSIDAPEYDDNVKTQYDF